MWLRAWLSLLLVALSLGCGCRAGSPEQTAIAAPAASVAVASAPHPLEWPEGADQLLTAEVRNALAKAQWVEVQAIDPNAPAHGEREWTLAGTVITRRSPRLPESLRRDLLQMLGDPKSYRSRAELSSTNATLNVRVGGEGGTIDIGIDWERNLLSTAWLAPGPLTGRELVADVGFPANFGPIRPRLIKLLQAAFPEEPTVQSLPEKSNRVKRELGDEAMLVLTSPDAVESFRIWSTQQASRRRRLDFATPWLPTIGYLDQIGVDIHDPVRWAAKAWADSHKDELLVDWFRIIRRDPAPSTEVVDRFREALLDDSSYELGGVWMCFDPGVAFRFTRGDRSITFLVCLKCRQVKPRFSGFGKPDEESPGLDNLSPEGRQRFVDIAKLAFPDDPVIQKLE